MTASNRGRDTWLWALVASAAEIDSTGRAALSNKLERWIDAGGRGMVLATCHRVELYGVGPMPMLEPSRVLSGSRAVGHLLRVACGLESVIVGENEVLHQVRDALRSAQQSRRIDSRLQRLFETAIATGRKARSGRTESSANLAQFAIAWLGTKTRLAGGMVVVAGAGRMGAALAQGAARAGAEITVASRNAGHASSLANVYRGCGVSLDQGAHVAGHATAVAVALGGPWRELGVRAGIDLPPVADISSPQAVPDRVRSQLDGSFLGIDDLYCHAGQIPGAYTKVAEELVDVKTNEYMAWLGQRL